MPATATGILQAELGPKMVAETGDADVSQGEIIVKLESPPE